MLNMLRCTGPVCFKSPAVVWNTAQPEMTFHLRYFSATSIHPTIFCHLSRIEEEIPSQLPQLFWGWRWFLPKPAERYTLSSGSWVRPKAFSEWEPPQLIPFDVEEQMVYSELLTLSLIVSSASLWRKQIFANLIVISFFQSLPTAHEHTWGFECRLTGKGRASPADSALTSPRITSFFEKENKAAVSIDRKVALSYFYHQESQTDFL